MVNRPFPWQWVKWVGLSNNQEYKNVRNAAKAYATVLNKYATQPRTAANNKVVTNAKNVLTREVNKYLAGGTNVIGPAYKTLPPGERMGPAQPNSAPAPAPGTGRMLFSRNGKINGATVANSNGVNFRNGVNVYKVGSNFYAASKTRNGANIWVPAKRADRLNPLSKRFIKMMVPENKAFNKVVNSATGKVSFVQRSANAAPSGPSGANRIAFGKFMMLAPTLGSNTVNKQAKNYLNGNNGYKNTYKNTFGPVNFNAVRRITRNTNVNAATRTPFWTAVNAEKARRVPLPKNLNKFKAWYATQASLASNANRADPYVTIIQGNNRNRKINVGGLLGPNNNNNNNRKRNGGFWNAVNAEIARRATGAA